MRLGGIGVQCQRATVAGLRVFKLPERSQRGAKVAMRVRIIGLHAERLGETPLRLAQAA